ncbi:MAG TPA: pyridoxamine 5'-phosphate oxidase family protein [Fimbriimonas sp.]|nr:pyridoxamine 5'-phosphate oxidase family protein [Fimbriimonas sp.]
MNSIDQNQPENNHQDLSGAEAAKKIKELVEEIKTCFFCTRGHGESDGTRPMAVQQVDDEGNLWFMSAKDSHKNMEIEQDSAVELFFQGSPHSEFLHLTGTASISDDRAKIEELWEPLAKVWFTEGKDDPRISVIKVTPTGGYYWDTKHGLVVASIKMLIGAALGKTFDDSIQGQLR